MENYITLFNQPIGVNVLYHLLPQKGKLVYEYNAFRNYRLTKAMFEYNRSLYSIEELKKLFNIFPKYYSKENTALFLKQKKYEKDGQNYYETIDIVYLNPIREATSEATINDIESTLETFYSTDVTYDPNTYKYSVGDYYYVYVSLAEINDFLDFTNNLVPIHLRIKFQNLAYETVNAQNGWENASDTTIISRQPGELVDFITDELQFDLKHPVTMIPQYSYDGSVN